MQLLGPVLRGHWPKRLQSRGTIRAQLTSTTAPLPHPSQVSYSCIILLMYGLLCVCTLEYSPAVAENTYDREVAPGWNHPPPLSSPFFPWQLFAHDVRVRQANADASAIARDAEGGMAYGVIQSRSAPGILLL